MRAVLVILALIGSIGYYWSFEPSKKHERDYQIEFCKKIGGVLEVRLSDQSRVDCLSDTYAIEIDFAKKWAESIGQSLFYAQMTNKNPAIGIIADTKADARYLKRLYRVAKRYDIRVFEIEP